MQRFTAPSRSIRQRDPNQPIHSRHSRSFAASTLTIFLAITLGVASAQQKTTPQINDPELYLIGLSFVRNIYSQSLVETDPVKKTSLHNMLLKDIGVSEGDLSVLIAESQRTLAIVSPTGGKSLQGTDRVTAISAATQRLRGALSAKGWGDFQNFVNGPLRQSTVIFAVTNK